MENHTYSAHILMKKGKRGAASYIHNECVNQVSSRHLIEILDILLNPAKAIDEWETIDWLKWLIAGGKTPDEYSTLVRKYDNATTCGLVWIANYVAYRCRTCGISPCMSLCSECFKRADHTGHDFNMFRSQAGGACDCGDTSVMKVSGFCDRHGPNAQVSKLIPPQDLLCVAEGVMPRIILRLIQHLRENSKSGSSDAHMMAIIDADDFITMFHDFCNMGAAMRHVMTSALTNPQLYKNLLNSVPNEESEYTQYLVESQRIYQDALRSLPNPEPPPEFRHCQALQEFLVHNTFLDELVFWTVKFEFPQKIVTLLLNMLPDPEYKEALTQAFVLHYSRIAMMLERSTDPDTLSNRVVHVSVQLFSNESLAYRMTEQYYLLHIMVISLKFMMSKILIPNTLHNPERNFHFNVDCFQQVMKEHCYWPLVSDLNNVLSHRPIAIKFMRDDSLLEMWFSFLSMFQGMNVNQREIVQHIEFEPTTYYAAFSAELEASAYPMWALVSHIADDSMVGMNVRVINECLTALQDWFDAINLFTGNVNLPDNHQVSFHIPLHRYLSVFMCQAVNSQGVSLQQVLPPLDMLHLIMLHPLRIQVAFYEIINGLWVRNGLQIKGQAMTYIQCNFCNSMVDADLYLLQVCASQLPTDTFMQTVIDKFHMSQWLTFSPGSQGGSNPANDSTDYDTPMFESFLTFLATLVSICTNLGINQGQLTELELVTLLCMGDKTHSTLMELMPERCGSTQNRDFDAVLGEVADYRAPNYELSGNMVQGMYVPRARVWEDLYSPVHVLLRAVHRRDFQTSMDRYTEYISSAGRIKSGNPPWPPLRPPGPAHPAYGDTRRVLGSRLFHSVLWMGLYKAVHLHSVSEHVMALLVFLLEMTVDFTLRDSTQQYSGQVCSSTRTERRDVKDLDLAGWYDTDWLSENLRTVIGSIALNPEPNVTFDDSDSEEDWCNHFPAWSTSLVAPDSSPALLNLSLNQIAVIDSEAAGGRSEESAMEVVVTSRPEHAPGPSSSSTSLVQQSSSLSTAAATTSSASTSTPPPLAVMAGNEVVPSTPSSSAYPRPGGPPLPLTVGGVGVDVVPRLTTASAGVNGNGIPRLQGSNDVIPRLPHHHHKVMPYMGKRRNQGSSSAANLASIGNDQTIEANESIISLLLRLHSHLSGTPDSFSPDPAELHNTSRVGDGAFFVAKVLNRIMALDELCRQSVLSTREKLWPRQPEETEAERKGREERERSERRRKAKERQQKLMEEFATKQKQFMEKAMASKDEEMEWDEGESSQRETSKKEYDCVICNQTSPSTEEKPMGLVVLMQATSVLGHKRRTQSPVLLPTSDEERQNLRRDETLACEFDKRIEELDRNFDKFSWLVSVNLGWEGGVHVQTCGHHLHLDCLSSYLNSLRGQQSTREYTCPLCRQLANSVLPLPPQLGDTSSLTPTKETDLPSIVTALSKLLKENVEENARRREREEENKKPDPASNLMDAMTKAMQDMTNSTYPKFKHKIGRDSPFAYHHTHTLFLFVNSIARTNLEIELVQRGGTLVTTSARSPEQILQVSLTTPKRSCFMPLLHVLAVHSRLMVGVSETVLECLLQLAGIPVDLRAGPSAVIPFETLVPLLCRDPTALLMQFIMLLPLHIHQKCFSTIVKLLYNLLYFQVAIQLACNMGETERAHWRAQTPRAPPTSLADTLPLTIHLLDPTQLFLGDDTTMSSSSPSSSASSSGGEASSSASPQPRPGPSSTFFAPPEGASSAAAGVPDKALLESKMQELCLPFLRSAALLKHHIYEEPLPEEIGEANEFLRLVYYLELVTDAMDWGMFNAAVALSYPHHLPQWSHQLSHFINSSQVSARSLLSDHHIRFHQPRLLALPELYDKIFQYYHRKQCTQCQSIPRETSICLLCGTLVCLKENCCKQNNVCEAVQHSIDCGAGTGMFLVVTSSYVIVIRGKRACLWGSMYLDNHGEEDRELKRGKPLYLSPDRYKLLEQQWIAHRFDHTNKKWVGHRDSL